MGSYTAGDELFVAQKKYASHVLSEFISRYLQDDISKLVYFDFAQLRSPNFLGKDSSGNLIWFGECSNGFDPDDTLLARCIYFLLWAESINNWVGRSDLSADYKLRTIDDIGGPSRGKDKNNRIWRGDTLNSFDTALGCFMPFCNPMSDEARCLNRIFITRVINSEYPYLMEKVRCFYSGMSSYHRLGNFSLFLNKHRTHVSNNSDTWNIFKNLKFNDYMVPALRYLLGPSDDEKCDGSKDYRAFSDIAGDDFMQTFCFDMDLLSDNFQGVDWTEPAISKENFCWWRSEINIGGKKMTYERYLSELEEGKVCRNTLANNWEEYIDFCVKMIDVRGVHMVDSLKGLLG